MSVFFNSISLIWSVIGSVFKWANKPLNYEQTVTKDVQSPSREMVENCYEVYQETEPILKDNWDRLVVYPIVHHDLWAKYEQSVANFWTVHEIDLSDDIRDWKELTEAERQFISHILAFFAASDGIVIENLAAKFLVDVKIPEARQFYAQQISVEAIHSETYSLLIDTLIKDPQEKEDLFNAVLTLPAVHMKAVWAIDWINGRPFRERLIAYACVEGIMFSGSFAAIFWLKSRGKMPGLSFSNQLIARDEALHYEFSTLIYKKLEEKVPEDRIKEIVAEAVSVEVEFLSKALPSGLHGINFQSMKEYIQFVADRLLVDFGCTKLFNSENPFSFMEAISLEGKTNFFERRVSEYQKARAMSRKMEGWKFTLDADF